MLKEFTLFPNLGMVAQGVTLQTNGPTSLWVITGGSGMLL